MGNIRIVHEFAVEGHPKDVWSNHNDIEKIFRSWAETMEKAGLKVQYEWKEEKGALRSLFSLAGEGAKGVAGFAKELTK